MASQPMTSTDHQSSLSISHQQQPPQHQPQSRPSSLSLEIHNEHQRSVGTQAKIGAPVKIISPRPWKSHIHQDTGAAAAATGNMSSGVSTSTSRLVNMITFFAFFQVDRHLVLELNFLVKTHQVKFVEFSTSEKQKLVKTQGSKNHKFTKHENNV